MKVSICSLRFAPGHAAHLRAYRELFVALGCETKLYLCDGYKEFIRQIDNVVFSSNVGDVVEEEPDLVVSYNTANKNIPLSIMCKKRGIPFYYVLHEPVTKISRLYLFGKKMPRRVAANVVNYITSKLAYKVLLASENGKRVYLETMKRCNANYAVFPLIFCDDYDDSLSIKRKYFSYIGGFTESRGCDLFLDFMEYALKKNSDCCFVIATRDSLSNSIKNKFLKSAISSKRVRIYDGRPMTSEEINQHYREAICVWNVYKRSNQSGVLPNALMQGAPVVVSGRPDVLSCVKDREEGILIAPPYNNDEILAAYQYIKEHLEIMEDKARKSFFANFHFSNYLELAKIVFEVNK